MTTSGGTPHFAPGDRLVVVAGRNGAGAAVADFAHRHPDWSVVRVDSILSGIAELCRSPASAVVAKVEAAQLRLDGAVAALREACGPGTRLVLCCDPEAEPMARSALSFGADDYVILPMDEGELEAALGIARPRRQVRTTGAAPPPLPGSEGELVAIAKAVEGLSGRPLELLQKLADMVRLAVRARGVSLQMNGASAVSGAAVVTPVMAVDVGQRDDNESEKAAGESGVRGTLLLGEKEGGPYTQADVEKVNLYAGLIEGLVAASLRERQWREMALVDAASGLPNRRFLHEQLPEILRRAGAEHFPVTLLLFDVDDFKAFNDRHVHDAGDEILCVVGQLFRKTCREQDIVTRYGGDEFAVVFWDPAGPRAAGSKHPQQPLSVVDRFTEALKVQSFSRLGPEGGKVTISGGLATFPWDAATADALITKADEALLSAKRAGKNRVLTVGGS